jgi:hypothetical protein
VSPPVVFAVAAVAAVAEGAGTIAVAAEDSAAAAEAPVEALKVLRRQIRPLQSVVPRAVEKFCSSVSAVEVEALTAAVLPLLLQPPQLPQVGSATAKSAGRPMPEARKRGMLTQGPFKRRVPF